MFTKIQSQNIPATRLVAIRHRDLESCPGDREISTRRLKLLRDQIHEGKFSSAVWAVAHCKETGKRYRVNGKHTSTLLAESEVTAPNNLQIVIDQYECDTLEDVKTLYGTFDTREASRSQREINRTFFSDDTVLNKLDYRMLDTLVAGANFLQDPRDVGRNRPTASQRADTAQSYRDDFIWIVSLYDEAPQNFRTKMRRVGCVAAMIETYHKDPTDAELFWRAVRDGNGDSNPEDPTRRAEMFLCQSSLQKNHDSMYKVNRQAQVTTLQMYAKLILFWNRYRTGSTMNVKFASNSPLPEAL